ncbi:hypothetical protein [Xylanimonas sp. McL0601]|uniref:hypothetical protein n=1 Tax=Xylanimonas sp. McL0601 TaxID=3414739 RepID=UPI003CE75F8F
MTRRRVIVATVVLALAAAGLALSGWLDTPHAAVLAAVALVAYLAYQSVPPRDEAWPKPPAEARPGARLDVSELGWAAFSRDGSVTERVLRRVRGIASRRLAVHGVLWDGLVHDDLSGWGRGPGDAAEHHARAEQLLGRDVLAGLSTWRAAHPRTLETWFSALDRLVDAPDDPRSPR